MFREIQISNRIIFKPSIPIALMAVLIASYSWRSWTDSNSKRVITVTILSNWYLNDSKQNLLDFDPRQEDLPDYQTPPGAPSGLNIYHFGCSGCDHELGNPDPNWTLLYFWSELSVKERENVLHRLGYQQNAEYKQVLHGPFPNRPWAYRHGYLPPPPNPPLNPDAASTNGFPRHAL